MTYLGRCNWAALRPRDGDVTNVCVVAWNWCREPRHWTRSPNLRGFDVGGENSISCLDAEVRQSKVQVVTASWPLKCRKWSNQDSIFLSRPRHDKISRRVTSSSAFLTKNGVRSSERNLLKLLNGLHWYDEVHCCNPHCSGVRSLKLAPCYWFDNPENGTISVWNMEPKPLLNNCLIQALKFSFFFFFIAISFQNTERMSNFKVYWTKSMNEIQYQNLWDLQ